MKEAFIAEYWKQYDAAKKRGGCTLALLNDITRKEGYIKSLKEAQRLIELTGVVVT